MAKAFILNTFPTGIYYRKIVGLLEKGVDDDVLALTICLGV